MQSVRMVEILYQFSLSLIKIVFIIMNCQQVMQKNMIKKQDQSIEQHILQRFKVIQKLGEGAYGHVYKVQDKSNQKIYALKKIFDAFQHSVDAQRTYREIEVLKITNHPNIIKLHETFSASNNQDVYILFEHMQSDLYYAYTENAMKDGHFKYITYQIAKALKYLHSAQLIHRDLKPSNILVNSNCKIKLCDFGLVRSISNIQNGKAKGNLLTEKVATRWYRAPQILLGSRNYSTPIDIWSFACIIYEMIQKRPLFPGKSIKDQLIKILEFTGIPSQQDMKSLNAEICQKFIQQVKPSITNQRDNILKNITPEFRSLLKRMLIFNPQKRISVDDILSDPMFKMFRKVSSEIVMEGKIDGKIDDNKRLTVDQYRRLIYNRVSNDNTRTSINQEDLRVLKKMKSCQSITKQQSTAAKKPKIQLNYHMNNNMEYMPVSVNSPMAKRKAQFMKSASKVINDHRKQKQSLIMDKTVADISQLPSVKQIYVTKKRSKHLLSPKHNRLKSQSKQLILFSPKKSPKNNFTRGFLSPNYSHYKMKQQSLKQDYFRSVNDHQKCF